MSCKSSCASTLTAFVVIVATAVVYGLGLSGPLLLDDHTTLEGVRQWLAGSRSWLSALLPDSNSIIFSRPVSMASLVTSAWFGDDTVFAYKLGNLILHLLCGLLGWALVRRLLRLDSRLSPHADTIAITLLAIWLLHPLHVSTVLYVVQRMAQLAALFTLAAVITYLVGRQQLSDGRTRLALLNLFGTFPLLLTLGLLSKQNAAVAPLLCFVLEIAYFQRRPRGILAFFAIFLAAPAMAATALLVFSPDRLLSGYADWDFTLTQRLLTQPRALFDYIGMWFIPRSPQMGLYTDAYPISTSLFSPPTTALAIFALAALSAVAVALRKRHPTIFAGWFFFLGAHAVESTFLPLEMYYEHRNYLPSIGLLLAATGCGPLICSAIKGVTWRPRATAYLGTAVVGVLAFSTLGRVLVWQDETTIVAQGIRQHPDSLRARLDSIRINLEAGNLDTARRQAEALAEDDAPYFRTNGYLYLLAIGCAKGQVLDPGLLERAVAVADATITAYDMQAVQLLLSVDDAGGCTEARVPIADAVVRMLEHAKKQPETSGFKATTRIMALRLYARAGRWDLAEDQARTLWKGNGFLPSAGWLARCLVHNGKIQEARELIDIVKQSLKHYDTAGHDEIRNLELLIENASGAPP